MIEPCDLAIIRSVLAPFAGKIREVAVFGSRALGTARRNSDIDLVIDGDLADEEIDRLWTLLDDSGVSVTIDLIALRLDMYPPLKRHIEKAARTVLTHSDLLSAAAREPLSRDPALG